MRLQAVILQFNAAMPDEISLDLEADARVIRPDKFASSSSTIQRENERKAYMDGAICHSNGLPISPAAKKDRGVISVRKYKEGHHPCLR